MSKVILHIDFNSYFASVEQQANPRLRGKPVGVTGGDRLERTVLCTASIEAKKLGVKTGMQVWEAKRICPEIIIVCGDGDKYFTCTTKFLNILKDYSPNIEVFSIDESFLELVNSSFDEAMEIALNIKARIKEEIGEVITCSVGISYNKLMAKLAGSLKKPDGLIIIPNQAAALEVLDKIELDDICGIGPRIKKRLFNLGIRNFIDLKNVPKECLLASFKSYGEILFNMARGIDHSLVKPFFEKDEVKSIGHRHTLDFDIDDLDEIKQVLLKICEMIASRLRNKNLVGKTVHLWYRSAFNFFDQENNLFKGGGMQKSLSYTSDGMEIFKSAWEIFESIWDKGKIRMIGASISNLKPGKPKNISFLPEVKRQEKITLALDKVNHKFGDFTVQRGSLLRINRVYRKPNPFLADRRFKL